MTASSHEASYPLAQLTSPADSTRDPRWKSIGETAGASVTVTWPSETTIGHVDLRAPSDAELAPGAGTLTFSDGSSLSIRSDYNGDYVSSFHERRVRWARLTVTSAEQTTAHAVGLSSLRFTDDAPLAVPDSPPDTSRGVTASSSAGTTTPQAVVDGAGGRGGADLGASWWSAGPGPQWIDVKWSTRREISSVQIYGSPDSDGRIASGTLEFADGTSVVVGGVAAGNGAPTTVAFMPRVTNSVRFLMQAEAAVSLRELIAFDAGHSPAMPNPGPGLALVPPPVQPCEIPPTPPTPAPDPRVLCPAPGSVVEERLRIVIAATPGATVDATAWSTQTNDVGGVQPVAQTTVRPDGYGEIDLDARQLLRGPATVRLNVSGDPKPLYVQIVNPHGTPQPDHGPPQTGGMTMTWNDDFRSPLSISQSGRRTVYTATKPSHSGPSEFGSAVFADPAWGTNSIGTVGEEYLRIRLTDLPSDRTDPLNWGRKYMGGILSSAALDGSGFSAQYGYFESRILGAPGEGTWPAFWALSDQSLVDPAKPTGELDTVELYGHDKRSSCHSVHSWSGNKDQSPITQCLNSDGMDDWALQWHTYGARMTPTKIYFYIDGHEVATSPAPIAAVEPYYFMLDLSAGGGWPIDLSGVAGTSDLYVDYVRVYV